MMYLYTSSQKDYPVFNEEIFFSLSSVKGRSCCKQYMHKKPIKRGFEVWSLCDSKTGYLYKFIYKPSLREECLFS